MRYRLHAWGHAALVALCMSESVWGAEPQTQARLTTPSSGVTTAGFQVPETPAVHNSPAGEVLRSQTAYLLGGQKPNGVVQVSGTVSAEQAYPKGTSAEKVKQKAKDSIPLNQMTPEGRQLVERVIHDAGFFRRTPTLVFPTEPEVYAYFIDCPESAVSIWRAMDISQLKLQKTEQNCYFGDAGDGTVGSIQVLFRSADRVVVYCDGEYKSPFLKKPIIARSVLHLETSFFRESDGQVYTTHRADLFVAFPSQTVETVAKVLAPLTAPIADRTFTEVSMFLKMMSLAMGRRPDWVQQLASRMEGVPEGNRTRMLELCSEIHERNNSRDVIPASRTVSTNRNPSKSGVRIPAMPASNPGRPAPTQQRSSKGLAIPSGIGVNGR